MMVPDLPAGSPSVLDRLLGTPVETCVTLLAVSLPHGSAVDHLDVADRADSLAETATVAGLGCRELAVGAMQGSDEETVDQRACQVPGKASRSGLL